MTTKENGKKSMIIQQAFYDLADKYEKECGDWQQEPEVPQELHDRIMKAVMELEQKKEAD